jgi:hypothetical protein
MAYMKTAKLRQLYTKAGPSRCQELLTEALADGSLKPEDFSLREMFEALVVDEQGNVIGGDLVRMMDPRKSAGFSFLEAGASVSTTAFSNITGQIVYSRMLEEYKRASPLTDSLCTTIPTVLSGEKIPGISGLSDDVENVGEGKEYPHAGVSEEYIETPLTIKSGLIVDVTKEAVFFDRTGLVLRRAADTGRILGVNKEKRILDAAIGTTNNYKWKGTAYNTYYATGDSGPWTNKNTIVFADWTDVDTMDLLFDGLVDPVTGEPIIIGGRDLLVPSALRSTAARLLNATEIWNVGNIAAGTPYYNTIGGNPLAGRGINLLTSPMVKARSSSATAWWYGDFKRAFAYMENWPITVVQAPSNNEAEFNRDIVAQFKASERGVVAVMEPRYVTYSTGASG